MTTQEIIDELSKHFDVDTNYKMLRKLNEDGIPGLVTNVMFDITNKIPKNHFSPYFKINSIDQAKEIFKNIISTITDTELNSFFDKVLLTKHFNLSNDLFFTIFKSDRR